MPVLGKILSYSFKKLKTAIGEIKGEIKGQWKVYK
jgi:hypothetical protein